MSSRKCPKCGKYKEIYSDYWGVLNPKGLCFLCFTKGKKEFLKKRKQLLKGLENYKKRMERDKNMFLYKNPEVFRYKLKMQDLPTETPKKEKLKILKYNSSKKEKLYYK